MKYLYHCPWLIISAMLCGNVLANAADNGPCSAFLNMLSDPLRFEGFYLPFISSELPSKSILIPKIAYEYRFPGGAHWTTVRERLLNPNGRDILPWLSEIYGIKLTKFIVAGSFKSVFESADYPGYVVKIMLPTGCGSNLSQMVERDFAVGRLLKELGFDIAMPIASAKMATKGVFLQKKVVGKSMYKIMTMGELMSGVTVEEIAAEKVVRDLGRKYDKAILEWQRLNGFDPHEAGWFRIPTGVDIFNGQNVFIVNGTCGLQADDKTHCILIDW